LFGAGEEPGCKVICGQGLGASGGGGIHIHLDFVHACRDNHMDLGTEIFMAAESRA
jgi:hypothetical protein